MKGCQPRGIVTIFIASAGSSAGQTKLISTPIAALDVMANNAAIANLVFFIGLFDNGEGIGVLGRIDIFTVLVFAQPIKESH